MIYHNWDSIIAYLGYGNPPFNGAVAEQGKDLINTPTSSSHQTSSPTLSEQAKQYFRSPDNLQKQSESPTLTDFSATRNGIGI